MDTLRFDELGVAETPAPEPTRWDEADFRIAQAREARLHPTPAPSPAGLHCNDHDSTTCGCNVLAALLATLTDGDEFALAAK